MKKNKIVFIAFLCLFAVILSCEDTRFNDMTPPSIYIPNSGEIKQIVYKTGEPFVTRLGVYKSGIEKIAASATLSVMSQAELDLYNTEHGQNYKRLPDNCFNLKKSHVNFTENSQLEYGEIEINYEEIENLPEYDAENKAQYVIPVILSQSTLEVNREKEISLVNVLVRDPLIYFKSTKSSVKIETSSSEEYLVDLELAVDFPNTWDISIGLSTNEELVDDYNAVNKTNLKLLPEEAYSLSPSPAVIVAGQNRAKVKIKFNKTKIDYDEFLLPIAISNVSKFAVDTENAVHYVLVSRPAPRLDRKGWTIVDFSSEEASGEGEGQGVATCVLDGDPNTFWHSQWSGGTGQLPHHFTIDMQKTVTVASVDLQRRQGQRDTYRGEVYISNDNSSFVQTGSFEMAEVNEPQTFKVATSQGRYLKIVITESRRAPYANMAEVYVRGVE